MNPAAPPPGSRLCALDELPEIGAKRFDFRSDEWMFSGFVVRRGDELYGYVDSCPHNAWPLAGVGDQYLTRDKDMILCAAHGALFRIEDGFCVAGPCFEAKLTAWPVELRNGEVFTAETRPPPKKGLLGGLFGKKR